MNIRLYIFETTDMKGNKILLKILANLNEGNKEYYSILSEPKH